MPPQPMPRIDPPGVGIMKPPHTRRERSQKGLPVFVIENNIPSPITARAMRVNEFMDGDVIFPASED